MSNFASPTPQLDLTMQNLANAATVIQATAYYRQVEADPKSDIPRIERWKKIGNIAVILIDNKPIIQPGQLKILTDRLAR